MNFMKYEMIEFPANLHNGAQSTWVKRGDDDSQPFLPGLPVYIYGLTQGRMWGTQLEET